MDATFQKFKEKFIEESNSLIDSIEKDLIVLEKGFETQELIESTFRAMHTLKGISSMYGFDYISELTHHLESIWQEIRDKKLKFNKEIFEVTFHSIDHLRKLLNDEKLTDPANKSEHQNLLNAVKLIGNAEPQKENQVLSAPDNKAKEIASWLILFEVTEKIYFRGINLKNIILELSTLGEIKISKLNLLNKKDSELWEAILITKAAEGEIKEVLLFIEDNYSLTKLTQGNMFSSDFKETSLPNGINDDISIKEYTEKIESQKTKQSTTQHTNVAHGKSMPVSKRISVDSSKLDHLMFLVSELITINSKLNLSIEEKNFELFKQHLEKVDSLSKQFRNNALELRLVALSDTTLRFQRLIRDLSQQLGKKVEFKTSGTETELDKNTLDQLTEPLMHIIRNCIDHGIETPENRKNKGKSEHGTIVLMSYISGNYVFISISDDGNGIDFEKVRLKAVDKGIFQPSDKPEKKEIYDLIFLPGFSTAQSLTSVSGRGVGMDVVKKSIMDLRGEIIVDSDTGVGTSFTLKIPQSLSIIDSLLFKVEGNYFVIPVSEIEICMQVSEAYIYKNRHTSTIPYNEELVPFIDLRQLLAIEGSYKGNIKIVIIKNEDKSLGIIADKIIGEHQAVLKPMGKTFRKQKHIAAACELGDGKMAFMIDTNSLFKEYVEKLII